MLFITRLYYGSGVLSPNYDRRDLRRRVPIWLAGRRGPADGICWSDRSLSSSVVSIDSADGSIIGRSTSQKVTFSDCSTTGSTALTMLADPPTVCGIEGGKRPGVVGKNVR